MDVYDRYREPNQGCGWGIMAAVMVALLFMLSTMLCGCASTKTVQKVNYVDSTVVHHQYDTTHIVVQDTNRVEQHVQINDTSFVLIQFAQGGGTYNAKTGEATNVSSVQQSESHRESRDSIAAYKRQIDAFRAVTDSLTQQVSNYASELTEERTVPKRSGYDKFCSVWFWCSLIVLLLIVLWKVADYVPILNKYKLAIKTILRIV